ncbi:MAG TPA: aminotransferase class V-fold PLP-dependent enzyme, partial [Methylomirabilota bacterium]|nr:aminotransferase class V-fold PLP-dependent enzyme [Methylomirabilota bacterium]
AEPGDAVVVVVAGEFGRMLEGVARRTRASVETFPVEEGRPLDLERLAALLARRPPKLVAMVHNETSSGSLYPVADVAALAHDVGALLLVDAVSSVAGIDLRVDEWGVDVVMAAPHKCLAGPIGLAIVAVNARAWQCMERRPQRAFSYAYDLLRWRELWIRASRGGRLEDGAPRRQPVGVPTHLTCALGVAAELVLREGLPARFRRHAVAGAALRSGLQALGFRLFPHPSVLSSTVACAEVPDGVDVPALLARLREPHGVLISGGFGKLASTLVRIGTMGLTASPRYVLPTLSALELALRDGGHPCPYGDGVAAAQRVFATG